MLLFFLYPYVYYEVWHNIYSVDCNYEISIWFSLFCFSPVNVFVNYLFHQFFSTKLLFVTLFINYSSRKVLQQNRLLSLMISWKMHFVWTNATFAILEKFRYCMNNEKCSLLKINLRICFFNLLKAYIIWRK